MEERPYVGTELFAVRVWVENVAQPPQCQLEWRGKLSHVAYGTTWNFRGWPEMVDLMQGLAADLVQRSDTQSGSMMSHNGGEGRGAIGPLGEDYFLEEQVQE